MENAIRIIHRCRIRDRHEVGLVHEYVIKAIKKIACSPWHTSMEAQIAPQPLTLKSAENEKCVLYSLCAMLKLCYQKDQQPTAHTTANVVLVYVSIDEPEVAIYLTIEIKL